MKIFGSPNSYTPTHYNIVDHDGMLYRCFPDKTLSNFKCVGKADKANMPLGNTGLGSLVSKPPKNICIAIRNKIKELGK